MTLPPMANDLDATVVGRAKALRVRERSHEPERGQPGRRFISDYHFRKTATEYQ
jgi:hypothetical protein